MKFKAVALLALWLGVSLSLPAKKTPGQPLYVPGPVTLEGAEVPQGMYELVLDNNNSGVHVELWKGGRFVASGRGAVVKSGVRYAQNALLLRVNPDGSRSLIEIRLAGTAKSIVLQDGRQSTLQVSGK